MTGTRGLSLRIDAGDDPNWPRVQILVDDVELVHGSEQHEFIGFDPAQMLGPRSPLLPAEPARRVAVYQCSCGIAGCGCIAPLIEQRSETVVWSDFRNFVGVYDRPSVEHNPEGGERLRDLGYVRASATKVNGDESTYRLVMWDLEHCQVVVELQAPPGEPAAQADAMAEYVLSTPATEWNVTFRGGPWGAVRRPR